MSACAHHPQVIYGADTVPAGIMIGNDGKPYTVPVVQVTQPSSTTVTSPTQVASLENPWPNGYIYYTVPGLNLNLVTPWSAAILAYGYDYIEKQSLAQGYVPLANWWKLTAIAGGGINTDKKGFPLAGGMLNLVNATISNTAEFHIIVTGGYDFNRNQALAILSPSVQFLK